MMPSNQANPRDYNLLLKGGHDNIVKIGIATALLLDDWL